MMFQVFVFKRKSYKAETNGSKNNKIWQNIIKTTQKGSNLAQTGNFDHVSNLKYTCQAFTTFREQKGKKKSHLQ